MAAPLIAACRAAGLAPGGARLLHARANHTYHLPQAEAVVRLRHTGDSAEWRRRLASAVQITAWLDQRGFPTVRPLDIEPVTVEGWTVTFWHYLPIQDFVPAGPIVLGHLLRRLHTLPVPPLHLEPTNPLGSLRADLQHAGHVLPAEQRYWLLARSAEIAQEYRRIEMPLGHGTVHGDAHDGNLFRTSVGYVWGDWDSVSHGPLAQDLMPTLDGVLHFGQARADWTELCTAYGADPEIEHHPGMQLLCRARELRSLAAYIRSAPGRPDIQAELDKRLGTIIDGFPAIWRPI